MGIITQLGTVIASLIQIVMNLLLGIYQMIITVPSVVTMLTYSIAQLPPVLLIYATAFITISVVYLVIDR